MLDKLKSEAYKKHPQIKGYFESDSYKLGLIIHRQRVKQKLTQEQLANKAKIDKKTLILAETGGEDTREDVYVKIFQALEVEYPLEIDTAIDEITATT